MLARNRPEGRRAVQEKQHIVKEMREIYSDRHTRCYGSPRIASEFSARGAMLEEPRGTPDEDTRHRRDGKGGLPTEDDGQ